MLRRNLIEAAEELNQLQTEEMTLEKIQLMIVEYLKDKIGFEKATAVSKLIYSQIDDIIKETKI